MKKHVSCLLVGVISLLTLIPTGVTAEELKPREMGKEEGSFVMPSPDERQAKDELRWRDQLATAKAQRTGLLVVGISGAVAGTAVFVKGFTEFNEADNTPGCSRDGNEILCNDESSRATAQDKLDSGRSQMAIGLVVMGIGAGLSVWGVSRGNEASRLERVGKKKGYKVDVTTQGRDGMAVMLSRSF